MEHGVTVEGGKHRCYVSDNGISRRLVGCRHETPRQAIAHTVPEYVSPTRSVRRRSPSAGRPTLRAPVRRVGPRTLSPLASGDHQLGQ